MDPSSGELAIDDEQYEFFKKSGRPANVLAEYLCNIDLKSMPGWENVNGKILLTPTGRTFIRQMCYILTMLSQDVVIFLQRLGTLFADSELKLMAETAAKGINNAKMRLNVNKTIERLKNQQFQQPSSLSPTVETADQITVSSTTVDMAMEKSPLKELSVAEKMLLNEEQYFLTELMQSFSSKDVPGVIVDPNSARVELSSRSGAWLRDKIERILLANLPINSFMQRLTNMFTSTMRLIFTYDFCNYVTTTLLPNYTEITDGLNFCMQTFCDEPEQPVEAVFGNFESKVFPPHSQHSLLPLPYPEFNTGLYNQGGEIPGSFLDRDFKTKSSFDRSAEWDCSRRNETNILSYGRDGVVQTNNDAWSSRSTHHIAQKTNDPEAKNNHSSSGPSGKDLQELITNAAKAVEFIQNIPGGSNCSPYLNGSNPATSFDKLSNEYENFISGLISSESYQKNENYARGLLKSPKAADDISSYGRQSLSNYTDMVNLDRGASEHSLFDFHEFTSSKDNYSQKEKVPHELLDRRNFQSEDHRGRSNDYKNPLLPSHETQSRSFRNEERERDFRDPFRNPRTSYEPPKKGQYDSDLRKNELSSGRDHRSRSRDRTFSNGNRSESSTRKLEEKPKRQSSSREKDEVGPSSKRRSLLSDDQIIKEPIKVELKGESRQISVVERLSGNILDRNVASPPRTRAKMELTTTPVIELNEKFDRDERKDGIGKRPTLLSFDTEDSNNDPESDSRWQPIKSGYGGSVGRQRGGALLEAPPVQQKSAVSRRPTLLLSEPVGYGQRSETVPATPPSSARPCLLGSGPLNTSYDCGMSRGGNNIYR